MKTVLDYLNEHKNIAWNNCLCYSKTYNMDTAKEGEEDNFAERVRDCEIVDYLINLVEKENNKADYANHRQSQNEILTYGATRKEIKTAQINAKPSEVVIPQSIYVDNGTSILTKKY